MKTGYRMGGEIYRSANSVILRGIDEASGAPVVIKMMPEEFPSPDRMARFRREHEMTKALQREGVIGVRGLEREGNGLAIVLEDTGGDSVAMALAAGPLELRTALWIATRAARALAGVHELRVMHKDINPANIVWNPATDDVRIIDFGISTALSREIQAVKNPEVIEGTLSYMSPEQTGRMNRAMDYRTDLYSFGVTLFEFFTHSLPFGADDPMEVVHSHIAQVPPSAHQVDASVPEVIARIITKLMQKSAEDRYQTANAVADDLQRCLDDLDTDGAVADFDIATTDISHRFQVPQQLYGRDDELKTLLSAFGRIAAGGKEMVLVAGYSGIGKSALVHEVHKPIVDKRGYFTSGKFDQLARNIPYDSMIQAIRGLVHQLLTESTDALSRWREKILAAVGTNGRVITDIIREVELIIGEQPPVAELGPSEARNRFNIVFANFIRTFASADHPLTLFLDDLQWADLPSLQLLKQFMTDAATGHMLVIGAYRDNEVSPSHPLMLTLDEMAGVGAVISTIELPPIGEPHVAQLIADTVNSDVDSVASLTAACMEKTRGNPFFLNRFLLALFEGGAINFDAMQGRWTWDLARIDAMEITDNVVDLMARKIASLGDDAQHVLQLAACVGNTFDLRTLAIVNESTVVSTGAQLAEALREGLVVPRDESYKFLHEGDLGADGLAAHVPFRFLHDRVQQAAYSLIDASRRDQLHGTIGRLMLERLAGADREANLFAIVGHLNHASGLLTDAAELEQLARLNLEAGLKANASAAYQSASAYLAKGIELLGPDSWASHYELTLSLHSKAVLSLNQSGQFEAMDRLAAVVMEHARTPLDLFTTYESRVWAAIAQAELVDAVAIGVEYLKLVGEEFPDEPQPSDIEAGLGLAIEALGGRSADELLNLPANNDAAKAAAIRMLADLVSPTYLAAPTLFPLVVFRMVTLSTEYGNTGVSGYGYTTYAIFVCGVLNDFDTALSLGDLGNRLIAKYDAQDFLMRTAYIPFCFLKLWKHPIQESIDGLQQVFHIGLANGDLEFSSYSLMVRNQMQLFTGAPLETLDSDAGKTIDVCAQLKQEAQMSYATATRQAVQNLRGLNDDPTVLTGAVHDEASMLARYLERTELYGLCNLLITKVMLGYLFDDHRRCLEHAELLKPYFAGVVSLIHVPTFHFYDTLARLAVWRDTPDGAERDALMAEVDQTITMFEPWARHGPHNFEHRLLLMQGERAAAAGSFDEARRLLSAGAKAAAAVGFTHEEALGYELLGRAFLAEGEAEVAGLYLTKAWQRFGVWGAEAKAKQMTARYGAHLRRNEGARPTKGVTVTATSSASRGTLDLDTVLKASQAISKEIRLDRLLAEMMRIVLESAGAERGVMLLGPSQAMTVVATADLKTGTTRVADEITDGDDVGRYSEQVVNLVGRTGEPVVVDDASQTGPFTEDAHIKTTEARSVLCTPIIHQGEHIGVVYLENNLTPNAFTEARIAVLEMLLGQIAISIENARLYATLENKVQERTEALAQSLRQVEEAHERLKVTQEHLVQSGKMASLGTLVAGVAHEINNPASFTYSGAVNMERRLGTLEGELGTVSGIDEADRKQLLGRFVPLKKNLSAVIEGSRRIATIVKSLRTFSRLDEAERQEVHLVENLESTLMLVGSRYQAEVTFETRFDADPLIACRPAALNQVFMNLVVNGCQAVGTRRRQDANAPDGKVSLATRVEGDLLCVVIEDNGCGMSEEQRLRIFEPFYTTKDVGEGTGLGLSISYGILDEHGATVDVTSTVGEGSRFTIWLPLR